MPYSATSVTSIQRYIPVGTRQYNFCPTMANYHTPTLVELNAGKDLTASIAQDGVTGFATTADSLDAGDMSTRFVPKVPGLINSEDSSLNFYLSKDGVDARTVFTRDATGYISIASEGFIPTTGKMDVFPVVISSVTKMQGGADVSQLTVTFTITQDPAVNITVPAT